MKDIIIIIVLIGIILGGDFYVKNHLQKSTGELLNELENLKEKIILAKESEDRQELKETLKETEQKWREISNIWSIVIMHQEIDNIEQTLVRAKSNIYDGKLEDAISEVETAIFFANHINEREQLKLKNIF